jgi:hypothetical protein
MFWAQIFFKKSPKIFIYNALFLPTLSHIIHIILQRSSFAKGYIISYICRAPFWAIFGQYWATLWTILGVFWTALDNFGPVPMYLAIFVRYVWSHVGT